MDRPTSGEEEEAMLGAVRPVSASTTKSIGENVLSIDSSKLAFNATCKKKSEGGLYH
jgi:hypothetical protein